MPTRRDEDCAQKIRAATQKNSVPAGKKSKLEQRFDNSDTAWRKS